MECESEFTPSPAEGLSLSYGEARLAGFRGPRAYTPASRDVTNQHPAATLQKRRTKLGEKAKKSLIPSPGLEITLNP